MKIQKFIVMSCLLSIGLSHSQWNYDNQSILYSDNSNVGVGTSTPSTKLHVYETAIQSDAAITVQNRSTWDPNATASMLFTHSAANFSGGKISSVRDGLYRSNMINTANSSLVFFTAKNGVDIEHMRIDSDGKVGIGTQDTGDFQLAVEGMIGAREVGITLDGNWTWPDYVFRENYALPSLEFVKSFINTNGHLPEIPSEKQIDEEGIRLAELNIKILKKVEELTLYLIEQNETIKDQQKQINDLKEQINSTLSNDSGH